MIKEDRFNTMALLLCLDHRQIRISIDTIDERSPKIAMGRKKSSFTLRIETGTQCRSHFDME